MDIDDLELDRRSDHIKDLEAEIKSLESRLRRAEAVVKAVAAYRDTKSPKFDDLMAWVDNVQRALKAYGLEGGE